MRYIIPLGLLFFITSCGGEKVEETPEKQQEIQDEKPKFLPKDLSIITEGLSCDDTYLYAAGMKTTSLYYKYGEKVFINFIQVKGFKEVGGKIFPRIDGYVYNAEGDTLVNGYDLDLGIADGYQSETGGIDLNTNVYFDYPFLPNENYNWEVYISDRNSDKFLKSSVILNIAHNDHIKVEAKNGGYNDVYLYDMEEGLVIRDNTVIEGSDFKVYFDGLSGFKIEDEKAFPGMEVSLKSAGGDQILYAENAISDYAESGLDAKLVVSSLYTLIELPDDESGEMQLMVRIYDLKGKAEITTNITLNVRGLG